MSGTTFSTRPGDSQDVGELVGGLLEQIVAFNRAHPGFKALFSRTDMPAGLREAVAPVQEALHARVHALISELLPGRTPDESGRVATVAIQIVRGMMPLITEADGENADALAAELHRVLVSYLRSQREEQAGRSSCSPQ